MKATLLLCDHAQVAEGKLYCMGAGWTQTGPDPTSMAIALIIDVPWDRTNQEIIVRLELREQDGSLVQVPGPAGLIPVRVDAGFEVGRPVGVAPGSSIPVPMAIPVQNLQLTPGRRFYWELTIAEETREDWTLHFATRPLPQVAGPGGPADFPVPPAG